MIQPASPKKEFWTLPKKVFWTFIGTGLILPAVMALFVITASLVKRKALDIGGDDLFFFVLVTVLFSLPYLALAFIARAALRRVFEEGGYRLVRRSFVFRGIYLCMTIYTILYLYLSFTNPQEALPVLITAAPIVPFEVIFTGTVSGWIVGLISYSVWKFSRRQDGG